MSDEENKGFKVTDRRMKHDEEDGATDEPTAPAPEEPAAETPDEGPAEPAAAEADAPADDGPPPADEEPGPQAPMTFSTLLLSLGTSALAHLGEVPDPMGGEPKVNLGMARQTIDIIGMLEEKTKGNLTDEEQKLLTNLLYDLRIRFVQAQNKKD